METIVVAVPDLGEAQDVELIEICVAVGDTVEEEASLVVLESEKASMEVPSPVAGVVREILLSEGSAVQQGDAILKLETAGTRPAEAPSPPAAEAAEPASPGQVASAPEARQDVNRPGVQDASAVPGTAGENIAVPVPDLGEAQDVELIEVCVAVGDTVAEEQPLVVLESEKASMEVPSPAAGVVREILLSEGSAVQQGDVILQLETAGAQQAAAVVSGTSAPSSAPRQREAAQATQSPGLAAAPSAVPAPRPPASAGGLVYAGPAVRKLAREFGIELQKVSPSGARGRILKEDLHRYVREALEGERGGAEIPPLPEIDFSAFGEVEIRDMEKLHRAVAHNMLRSWLNVPHVTQFEEVDASALEKLRGKLKPEARQRGLKLTPLSFLLRAAAGALQQHPYINASLHPDGRRVVFKKYVHIGIAVDTPAGLLVPVIRDVERKDLWDLSRETVELAEKARQGKLSPREMQGGCFTISSLGAIGGIGFTPVVNAPEVAILGVARLAQKPLVISGQVEVRTVLPLSLSYDHRAVNGALAGRFFSELVQVLEQPESLLE